MSDINADLDGPISPPRDNGEIVFAAPWEQRVFGLTIALCRSPACDWEAFRRNLIRRIAGAPDMPYWQNWTLALEDVLTATSTITPSELDTRSREVLNRPPSRAHHH